MHKTAYSLSMPKHNYYAPLSKRFPEDIECIIQSPHRDRGSLYISNIEAAENPNTLQSTRPITFRILHQGSFKLC